MAVKVTDALRRLGVDGLAAALRHHPDLLASPPGTLEQLANRVGQAHVVDGALHTLDLWQLQVAELLASLPEGAGTRELLAAMPPGSADADDLERALAGLRARLLVFAGEGAHRLNPGVRAVLRNALGLGESARHLLAVRPVDELRAVATRLHAAPAGTSRQALVDAVSAVLVDGDRVRSLLARADPAARRIVEAPRPHVMLPTTGWGIGGRTNPPPGPHQWLLAHGLLVATGWGTAEIPREVGLAVRGGWPLPAPRPRPTEVPSVDVGQEAADRMAADQAASTVQAITRLLTTLGEVPAEPLKATGLGTREVKRLAKAAQVDPERAVLLLEFAFAAGLLPPAVGRKVAPTHAADQWLAAPPAEQWTTLTAAWWAYPAFPSATLRSATDERPAPAVVGRYLEGEPTRRRAVAAMLGGLGPGRAPAPGPEAAAAARWRAPLAGGPREPGPLVDVVARVLDEAAMLGFTGGGALSSVGRALVDGDEAEAARRAADLLRPPPAEIILQADLTAVVDARVGHQLLSELRLLADAESNGAALVLRFSPPSVRRGLDAGRTPEGILAFLAAHAPHGVPQPLAYLVEDTARRWGGLRVSAAGAYVRSDDPGLLAEAVAHRSLGRLGLRLLAPTVAVAPVAPDRLLDALRQAGFLPAAEDEQGAVLVTAVRQQRVEPARRRPVPGAPAFGADAEALARRLLEPSPARNRPLWDGSAQAHAFPAFPALPASAADAFDEDDDVVHDEAFDGGRYVDDDAFDLDGEFSDAELEDILRAAHTHGSALEFLVYDHRDRLLALTGRVTDVAPGLVTVAAEPRGDLHDLAVDDIVGISFREANRR